MRIPDSVRSSVDTRRLLAETMPRLPQLSPHGYITMYRHVNSHVPLFYIENNAQAGLTIRRHARSLLAQKVISASYSLFSSRSEEDYIKAGISFRDFFADINLCEIMICDMDYAALSIDDACRYRQCFTLYWLYYDDASTPALRPAPSSRLAIRFDWVYSPLPFQLAHDIAPILAA